MDLEPLRVVPVRLRAGTRSRTLAITGMTPHPGLNRIVTRGGRAVDLPEQGLVLSRILGTLLGRTCREARRARGSTTKAWPRASARCLVDNPILTAEEVARFEHWGDGVDDLAASHEALREERDAAIQAREEQRRIGVRALQMANDSEGKNNLLRAERDTATSRALRALRDAPRRRAPLA